MSIIEQYSSERPHFLPEINSENRSLDGEHCCCPYFVYQGADAFATVEPDPENEPGNNSNAFWWKDWQVVADTFWFHFAGAELPSPVIGGHTYHARRLKNLNETMAINVNARNVWVTQLLYMLADVPMIQIQLATRANWDKDTSELTVDFADAAATGSVLWTWTFDFSAPANPRALEEYLAVHAGVYCTMSRAGMPGHPRPDYVPATANGAMLHEAVNFADVAAVIGGNRSLTGTIPLAVDRSGHGKRMLEQGRWRHASVVISETTSAVAAVTATQPHHGLLWEYGGMRTGLSAGQYSYTAATLYRIDYSYPRFGGDPDTMDAVVGLRNNDDDAWVWRGRYRKVNQWDFWDADENGMLSGEVTLDRVSTLNGSPPATVTCQAFSVAPDGADADFDPPAPINTTNQLGYHNAPVESPQSGHNYMPVRWKIQLAEQPIGGTIMTEDGERTTAVNINSIARPLIGNPGNMSYTLPGIPDSRAGWLSIFLLEPQPEDWVTDPEAEGYIGEYRDEQPTVSITRLSSSFQRLATPSRMRLSVETSTVFEGYLPFPFDPREPHLIAGEIRALSETILASGGEITVAPILLDPPGT